MRIIYFGSDAFGIPSLEKLKEKYNLLCVITAPDKPAGRGMKLSCTAVKNWAQENHIPVYQPEDISDRNFIQTLKTFSPELIVVISYGKILSEEIIKTPSLISINVHPSLLPKYRGPAPMEWALINGETETGISVITIKSKVDTGDIIKQQKFPIYSTDDIFLLRERLSKNAPDILIESIEDIRRGIQPQPQHGTPSYARRLKKEDGLIRWNQTALEIHNLIRGVKEWPGAYTYLDGKYIKIHRASPIQEESNKEPGEIIKFDKCYIYVACGNGVLKIEELQIEGKKRMSASEFLNGYPVKKGNKFSEKRCL
ncbi:MAG: methionyl-tRNA formyltransferase [Candidatus Ratteibacteria bacterium]|nr:methionyl-tRNA formyltransferase [Candidatus Ratteibacteria bacterium]